MSMDVWIIALVLTASVVGSLLVALRKTSANDGLDHDAAFYRSQVDEIDRLANAGLMQAGEAKAARVEAARRLLAAEAGEARAASPSMGGANVTRRLTAIATIIAIPAIAIPLYWLVGSPSLPAQPLASRNLESERFDIDVAVSRIEAHIRSNPEDGRAYDVVAPVYLRLARFTEAENAFRQAIRLLGPTAERHAGLGETLLYANRGVFTPQAEQAFNDALKLDPKNIRARIYLSDSHVQAARPAEALALLRAVDADLPDGAMRTEVRRRMAALDPAAAPPPGDQAAAIQAMPQAERSAAIRGMVEGLAQRLAETGGTAPEWAQLIRALRVLGEAERAGRIVVEARGKFAADPASLSLINEAATIVVPGGVGQ